MSFEDLKGSTGTRCKDSIRLYHVEKQGSGGEAKSYCPALCQSAKNTIARQLENLYQAPLRIVFWDIIVARERNSITDSQPYFVKQCQMLFVKYCIILSWRCVFIYVSLILTHQ